MKVLKRFILLFALTAGGAFLWFPSHAAAFTSNNLIDDSNFNSVGSMNAAQIDAFLNSFPNSCISTNSGFSAKIPNGYSRTTGYSYGGFASAGQIIAASAQVYGLNPRVMLVTLQKEQSLVSGGVNFCDNGDENKYTAAVGYGCPDSGTVHSYTGLSLYKRNGVEHTSTGYTCVNTPEKAGFSQQLIRGTWLLKFGQQRSLGNTGWAVITGNWDNSDDPLSCYGGPMTQGTFKRCSTGSAVFYDGYTTIDGVATHMDSGGTSALYWYTPHFHGNQNFVALYTQWFGNPVGPGYGFVDAVNPPGQINPNDVVNARIRIRNLSGKTWYSDGHVPTNEHALRLALFGYQNNPYGNPADSNWLGTANQIRMQEISVADGDVATFDFTYRAPLQLVNNYFAQFTPVYDGANFLPYIGLSFTTFTPSPIYSYKVTDTTGFTGDMPTNFTAPVSYTIQNTGNVVWFSDAAKPAGTYALRLLTANPYYHASDFFDRPTWLASNQIALDDSRVSPGASTTVSFSLKTPAINDSYTESFGLVLDGATNYPDTSQMSFSANVSDYKYSVVSNNIPANLNPGQRFAAKIILKNTGAATWYADGSTPPNVHAIRIINSGYSSNPYADKSDPAWLGTSSQIKMMTPNVAPGQNGEFDFFLQAPYTALSYTSNFRLVLDGVYFVPQLIQNNISTPPLSASYTVQGGVHPSPAPMSKGQISNGKLILRNSSNFVWYADGSQPAGFRGGSTRLVMTNPYYRSSVFANSADSAWLGTSSQIKMATPVVSPGDNAEFNFTWKAPIQTGFYRERFSLVLDGYLLFPDVGMEIDTAVQ